MSLSLIAVLDRRCFRALPALVVLLACRLSGALPHDNPTGPTVTQGTATFSSQGSQLTIQTSDHAAINWQSFDIGVGHTTTFLQPSSSSVVWNQINDPNPSQILGTLNANGYVVLQSPAGFYIGGQATLNTHGLLMTTARCAPLDLVGGGAWQFNAPPPTASIINYGQINVAGGSSAFLIAHDIENHGTISAPQGSIGLYAGKQVLMSERPDGRGLSATVTLPEGSVDNSGKLIADAGTIAMHAKVVNQGGLVQANSVREVNGVIELIASDAINLGANSVISAQGDSQGASPGGTITIKSDNTFSDQPSSTINISGGAQGGNGGQVEISAGTLDPPQSRIDGHAASGFLGGKLTLDPYDLTLDSVYVSGLTPIFNAGMYEISVEADHNITLSTVWTLSDPGAAAILTLTAGNNITLNDGSAIKAGNNWGVTLSAGPQSLTSRPAAGSDGIYLQGNSYIQTLNGNINLWAANEVIVNPGPGYPLGSGSVGNNGVRTLGGGNINVTAQFGDVNTGGNYNGYLFGQSTAPYYTVSRNLGGISTAAGGDVTITAGGDVTSFLPVQSDYNHAKYDGGTGAFGPQPGNVTIAAGGDVSGHYVLANGVGTITAGGNIGSLTASSGFALSLVKGSWGISAPNGSIYVQDIRNPNGVFNDLGSQVADNPNFHRFDYDPLASVLLQAGNSVEITGAGAPHDSPSTGSTVPTLFPPTLRVSAGAGGFVLDSDVVLFPSPNGELNITTTHGGNFQNYQDPNTPNDVTVRELRMSDSGATQWDPSPPDSIFGSFLLPDHATTPPELNNPNPVVLSIDGSIRNVNLRTTKATHIDVGGNMFNVGFLGQNLHAGDATYINAGGHISYPPVYAFTPLSQGIVGADPRNPSLWDAIFSLTVDPNAILQVTSAELLETPAQQTSYAYSHLRLNLGGNVSLQDGYDPAANPGFIYDPASGKLGFRYQMPASVFSTLDRTAIPILKLDALGHVVIEQHADGNYYFATTTVSFVPLSNLEGLYAQSQNSVKGQQFLSPGFQIGGPGQFNIDAASLDLGSSAGIISWGIGSDRSPVNYESLAPWTSSGAEVNVDIGGDISMLTSTIASIYGGKVTVTSGGNINLSVGNFALIPPGSYVAYGIWTSGDSDVTVTADQDINIGGARVATFNGGTIHVLSKYGNVNAGNGANSLLLVPVIYKDPVTGQMISGEILNPRPFGSGIIAIVPTAQYQVEGGNGLPGDIFVDTPQGDIVSTLGGIQQFALNTTAAPGPKITLNAGTAASDGSPGYAGNVDLGAAGAIGGTINITAQGSIKGLIVSRQNANINAAQSFSGTLLSGGTANVTATAGTISGTVVGIGGVNANASVGGITAALVGQNVSIGGGAAQSTLGTTVATSTSQAAAQQANTDTQQQLAKDTTQDDDEKKKKKSQAPVLTRRIGRVTVILPKT
jgi:filamentous hemagglutinin family protein